MNNCDCEKLKRIINMSSFAMDDTRLFLDTHPDSREAMMYFEKNRQIREHALNEYNQNFGPMCSYDVNAGNYWSWNSGPWPWEVEG